MLNVVCITATLLLPAVAARTGKGACEDYAWSVEQCLAIRDPDVKILDSEGQDRCCKWDTDWGCKTRIGRDKCDAVLDIAPDQTIDSLLTGHVAPGLSDPKLIDSTPLPTDVYTICEGAVLNPDVQYEDPTNNNKMTKCSDADAYCARNDCGDITELRAFFKEKTQCCNADIDDSPVDDSTISEGFTTTPPDESDSSSSEDSTDIFSGEEWCESGITDDQCKKSSCCVLDGSECRSAIGSATCNDVVAWDVFFTWTTEAKKVSGVMIALIIIAILLVPTGTCCILVFCCGVSCLCLKKSKQTDQTEEEPYQKATDVPSESTSRDSTSSASAYAGLRGCERV